MRILVLSTFFPPLNSIASLRPYSWAKYWTLAGHCVEVVTLDVPQDPALNIDLPNPGFTLHRVPLPPWLHRLKQQGCAQSKEGTGIKKNLFSLIRSLKAKTGIFSSCRMPDLAQFWVKPALKVIKMEPAWDLVISSAGPYPVHSAASQVKRAGKAKMWIADYRDRWSDSCIYPGLFPFTLIEKVWEKRLLRHADLLTTVSQPFADFYARKYPGKKVFAVENGMDPSDLEALSPGPIFPQDGKIRIAYTGSLYFGPQDPSPLFAAIASLRADPEFSKYLEQLKIVFAGPCQDTLKQLVDKYKIGPWVELYGFVSRPDSLRMQRDAHALLFLPWNDPQQEGVLTGKLFEYLYSNTPIVALGAKKMESAQELILKAGAGSVLVQEEEIKRYLIRLLQDAQKKKNRIDPNLLKRYDRQTLAMKLLHLAIP
jgi:glycosyltransferase involved in cell wall biosynthesis